MPKNKEAAPVAGKKGDAASKKTQKKQQEKIIEDRTFGLKNKNKSSKVQKFVKSVAQKVKGVMGKGGEQGLKDKEYKERLEKKKLQEKEELLNSLFNSVNDIKQQLPKDGEDSKSILCAFFKAGVCKKGDKCKFSHDLGIEKRAAKADLYTDMRNVNNSGDTMATWDQAYLEKVIDEKNKKSSSVPSPIVCKYFLDAVENRTYGWFWDCPNGETCQYRHCLPPGYVMKRDKDKSKEMEKMEEKRIEEIIDAEREELLKKPNLTMVTLETFKAWKIRKQEEKERKIAEDIKKESKKAGGKVFNMLSGRALFRFDPTAFQDDDEAMEEYNEEAEADSDQKTDISKEEQKETVCKEWNTSSVEEHNIQIMIEQAKKSAEDHKEEGPEQEESKAAVAPADGAKLEETKADGMKAPTAEEVKADVAVPKPDAAEDEPEGDDNENEDEEEGGDDDEDGDDVPNPESKQGALPN